MDASQMGRKEREIMEFLDAHVFSPALQDPEVSKETKAGVRLTRMRMSQRNAVGMISYFWSAIVGTEKSVPFADRMRSEGLIRFEDVLEDFRRRFNDTWLAS